MIQKGRLWDLQVYIALNTTLSSMWYGSSGAVLRQARESSWDRQSRLNRSKRSDQGTTSTALTTSTVLTKRSNPN